MQQIALRDPVNLFLKEVERYPLLSREEEYQLALKHYENNDIEAAKKLVVSNLRFVIKIANEYISYGFPVSDLIQEGTIGLMQAVKRFNPHKGYRLISYAVWWIKARIHNFIMSSWSLVKIGTTQAQRKLFQKIGNAKKKLNIERDKLGPEDLKSVADSFGVREKDVLTMEIRLASRDFSLDKHVGDDESTTYIDSLPDFRKNQEEIVEQREADELTYEGLQQGLDKLSEKQRYVIEGRFISSPAKKLRELGEELGISKERVRQIEREALNKIRSVIEKQYVNTNSINTFREIESLGGDIYGQC
ncbi:MAG: RNA polymerase factor sigma-32 [Thermodesulfobacteriota bacterium]